MFEAAPDFTAEDIEENLHFFIGSERLHALLMDALYRAGMKRDEFTN